MIPWQQILGPALFMYILYKWPYEIKVNWKYVKIFLKLEAGGIVVRGLLLGFFPQLIPKGLLFAIKHVSITQLLGVYWEDTFYVLPIVLLSKYIQPKFIIYSFMIFCAYNFGIGHMYQGILVSIYMGMYVICSFLFRRKIGIGTFMICHVVHDVVISTQLKWTLGL